MRVWLVEFEGLLSRHKKANLPQNILKINRKKRKKYEKFIFKCFFFSCQRLKFFFLLFLIISVCYMWRAQFVNTVEVGDILNEYYLLVEWVLLTTSPHVMSCFIIFTINSRVKMSSRLYNTFPQFMLRVCYKLSLLPKK